MVDIRSDVFIIPINKDKTIIYSPLRGAAFYANTEATNIVKKYKNGEILSPEEKLTTAYDHLFKLSTIKIKKPKREDINSNSSGAVFVLSQKCNLECSYCYARNSRSNEIISDKKVKTVVDYVFKNANRENIRFTFIGGGEPLVTWDLFEWAVKYIKQCAQNNCLNVEITLATNGTLFNEKRIMFLKENNILTSISFDILPNVQNKQRAFPNNKISSYDIVHNNIKLLLSDGIIPRIRSTITELNVNLMPQMVEFSIENYPQIKRLHFEPVTSINENNENYYKRYVKYFLMAQRIARVHNVYINNSIVNSLKRIGTQFCNGEFCVTPNGDIVSCHRISSNKEKFYNFFIYGKVNRNVQIDNNSLNNSLKKIQSCSKCFAKWHCAGGCPMIRIGFSKEQQLTYCKFVENMLSRFLDEKLKKVQNEKTENCCV